jgi:hypothetical protein
MRVIVVLLTSIPKGWQHVHGLVPSDFVKNVYWWMEYVHQHLLGIQCPVQMKAR